MRLATFNVENLFARAKAMNLDTWSQGKPALEDFARLNTLIQQETYSQPVKDELLAVLARDPSLLKTGRGQFISLYENRGKLLKRKKDKTVEVVAQGRGDWTGWFELVREPVNEAATANTARVMGLLAADVLCVVEAEDRVGLKRFNEQVLPAVEAAPFAHVMLIDGNDERGIDLGLMTRAGWEIAGMVSHVDDVDEVGGVFSRDCPEYEIITPDGNRLLLLLNHFKSKGYGKSDSSNRKRERQAKRVRELYEERLAQGWEYVAVLGDLNETPDGAPLVPLLGQGSSLTDIMAHPTFVGDGKPGTFGSGAAPNKLDYILMSPQLSAKATAGGVERRGVWGAKKQPRLDTMLTKAEAASDHAALWVDLDI